MSQDLDEPKPAEVKTGADRLLELVKASKEVAMAAAAKELGVSIQTVEAWANFLEEDGLVSIKYKFTTPYIAIPDASPAAKKRRQETAQTQEGGVEFHELKTEIEGMHSELSKAEEEKQAGEFGMLRQTYSSLVTKLKSFHDLTIDKTEVSPQEKARLNEMLAQVEETMQSASGQAEQNRFDEASASYSRLDALAKQAIDELDRLYEQATTASAVQETKDYKDILDKAYQLMTEGKIEQANELYQRLKFAHENLAKELIEKKRQMEDDLVKLNKDLAASADQANLQKLNKTKGRLMALLHAGNNFLKKGEFDTADSYYLAIRQEYETLPAGFNEGKKELQQEILNFYSALSKKREDAIRKKFDSMAKEIATLLKQTQGMLDEHRVDPAISLYKQTKQAYNRLPAGFLKEKSELQEKILSVHTAITEAYTKGMLEKLKSKSAEILALLGKMNSHTEKGELKEAEEAYEQVKELYREMPKGFLHEETTLQNEIVSSYESYLQKTKQVEAGSTATTFARIGALLEQAEASLKKNDQEAAKESYVSMVKLYSTLPHGFTMQKAEAREKMLLLYRRLLSAANESGKAAQTQREAPAMPPPPPNEPQSNQEANLPKQGAEEKANPQPAQEETKEFEAEAPGRADEGNEDSGAGDAEFKNLDADIEDIEKKIEELKSLSKATVKFPAQQQG